MSAVGGCHSAAPPTSAVPPALRAPADRQPEQCWLVRPTAEVRPAFGATRQVGSNSRKFGSPLPSYTFWRLQPVATDTPRLSVAGRSGSAADGAFLSICRPGPGIRAFRRSAAPVTVSPPSSRSVDVR